MKKLLLGLVFVIGACSSQTEVISVKAKDGKSSVMKIEDAGDSCLAGGKRLFFGLDMNSNGIYDNGDIPQSDFAVCNGESGVSPSVEILAAGDSSCPMGGVKVSIGTTSLPICNGSKGDKGDIGDVGPSGPPGVAGTSSKPVRSTSYVITGTAWHPDGTSRNKYKTIFYLDNNNDSMWQSAIDTKLSEFEVYEGRNAKVTTMTLANATECPTGGVVLKHSDYMFPNQTLSVPICNGQNGLSAYQVAVANGFTGTQSQWLSSLTGPVGPKGDMGDPGLNSSSQMVQLCPGDTAAFPEYGVISGKELYGVYNDRVSGYTFLAKLTTGTWETTNVADQSKSCRYTYENDGSYITLKNTKTNATVVIEI